MLSKGWMYYKNNRKYACSIDSVSVILRTTYYPTLIVTESGCDFESKLCLKCNHQATWSEYELMCVAIVYQSRPWTLIPHNEQYIDVAVGSMKYWKKRLQCRMLPYMMQNVINAYSPEYKWVKNPDTGIEEFSGIIYHDGIIGMLLMKIKETCNISYSQMRKMKMDKTSRLYFAKHKMRKICKEYKSCLKAINFHLLPVLTPIVIGYLTC